MKRAGLLLVLLLILAACGPFKPDPLPNTAAQADPVPGDKMSLWTDGTQLRGANIYQRRVIPSFDGIEFIGPGPFGPPYLQADFDRLAALGANYVNLSVPGLFALEPPFGVDEEAVANLDRLLAMAAAADLYTVITFRTGPGRSEYAILGPADWIPDELVIQTVWTDPDARDAWAAMWRYTAERYKDNPVVVGYDLMCEPNANGILDLWDPEAFYAEYAGSGYDWNAWFPDLVTAIRAVDAETPILVGGNSYSDITWLPYLRLLDDSRIVYTIHQYSPHEYTHQEPPDLFRVYPGFFDADYDGEAETFDRAWLEELLNLAAEFAARNGVTVAVNEFGAQRWEPGVGDYLRDEMALFEQHGWNYAVWQWYPAWPPLAEGDNSFNFRLGADPGDLIEGDNAYLSALTEAWSNNRARPSAPAP